MCIISNKKINPTFNNTIYKIKELENINEVPFISIYNISSPIDKDIKIEYYVTDWYQKENTLGLSSELFDILYSIDDNEYIANNIPAGNNFINISNLSLSIGEHTFSVQAVDKKGRKSHKIYEQFIIEKSEKNMYMMNENDLLTYKINNQNSENTEDLINNRTGLNNFFTNIKNQGYDGCILLNGIYRYLPIGSAYEEDIRHDISNSILIPSNFIIDLNGSTIKQHVYEGHGSVGIAFNNTFNSVLTNGIIEGDYGEHILDSPNNNLKNNGEHCYMIDFIGGKFNKLENLTIKNTVGYTTMTKATNAILVPWDRELEDTDINQYGFIVNSNMRRTTINYIDLSPLINKKRQYMYCAIYLGYSGFIGKSWIYDVHFFTENFQYIETIRSFQYRATKIPNNAKYAKITFHDKTLTSDKISPLEIYDWDIPSGVILNNVIYDNTRTCAIAFSQNRNFLLNNVTFNNCGQYITPLAVDLEDGWYNMLDITFRNLKFENTPKSDFLICSGHNVIVENCNCPQTIFAFRGGWNGCRTAVIRNSVCKKIEINHGYHMNSAFYRIYNNTILYGIFPSYQDYSYHKDIPYIYIRNNKFYSINHTNVNCNFKFISCEFDGGLCDISTRQMVIGGIKLYKCNIHDYQKGDINLFSSFSSHKSTIQNCIVGFQQCEIVCKDTFFENNKFTDYAGNNKYNIENCELKDTYFKNEKWSGSHLFILKENVIHDYTESMFLLYANKNKYLIFENNKLDNISNVFSLCLDPSDDDTFICNINFINNIINNISGYIFTKYYNQIQCPVTIKYIGNTQVENIVDPSITSKVTLIYE